MARRLFSMGSVCIARCSASRRCVHERRRRVVEDESTRRPASTEKATSGQPTERTRVVESLCCRIPALTVRFPPLRGPDRSRRISLVFAGSLPATLARRRPRLPRYTCPECRRRLPPMPRSTPHPTPLQLLHRSGGGGRGGEGTMGDAKQEPTGEAAAVQVRVPESVVPCCVRGRHG